MTLTGLNNSSFCMYSHQEFRHQAIVYKALGNERRIAILSILAKRRRNGYELAALLRVSFRAASKHIQKLRLAGIIDGERRGSEVRYYIRKGWNIEGIMQLRNLSSERSSRETVD